MNVLPLHFDREVSLLEALRGVALNQLQRVLCNTLGEHWQIVDANGTHVLGTAIAEESRIAVSLHMDIEVAGQLLASGVSQAQVEAAAGWIEMLLAASARYRMASDLHLEAVHADFETLQHQNAALQVSETKYRELSEQLNQRVQSQVDMVEQAQRQLYQAEKMASIGSLAAGMAHEINNPIGFIRSNLATASQYVELLTRVFENASENTGFRLPDDVRRDDMEFALTDFPGLMKESVSGADRIASIVANLKAFANIDCLADGDIDLNEVIQAATIILADQLPSSIVLETNLQPLPRIPGDRARLNQALFGIVQNAWQALDEKGGTIRVTSVVAGKDIRIDVQDNGRGIPPDIMSRIFDPFFTTQDVGKGTGLGLTVSRDIVAAHHGRIAVHSVEGGGTTVTILLPASADVTGQQRKEGNP